MSYILFFGLVFASLFVSGLFVFGVWEILTTARQLKKRKEKLRKTFSFSRNEKNPILNPGKYEFEQQAVMNPAAIHDGEKTHLFYRAIGNDGVSRIGYASSEDGKSFDDRLPYPVFALEGPDPHLATMRRAHAEKNYPHSSLLAEAGAALKIRAR